MALEPNGLMAKGHEPWPMAPKSLWLMTIWACGSANKLYQSLDLCSLYTMDILKIALYKPFLQQVLLILLLVR